MAKKKETGIISPLTVEIIEPIESTSLAIISNEEKFTSAVAELADTYQDYTIANVQTLADYEALKETTKLLVSMRTGIDKRRLAINKQTNDAASVFQSLINPLEDKLVAIRKEYEADQAAKAKAEADRKAKVFAEREAQLYALGAVWGGSMYQIGMAMATKADVENDEKWPGVHLEFRDAAELQAKAARIERARNERTREVMPLWLFLTPQFQSADLGTMDDAVYAEGIAAAKAAKQAKDDEDERLRREAEESRRKIAEADAAAEKARLDAEKSAAAAAKAEQDAKVAAEAQAKAEAAAQNERTVSAEQHAANERANAARATLTARKEELLALGARDGWEIDGQPVAKGTQGALFGVRLGAAFASREDLENDERWEVVLEMFHAEAKPQTPQTAKAFEPTMPHDAATTHAYLSGAYTALKLIAGGMDHKSAWMEIKRSLKP